MTKKEMTDRMKVLVETAKRNGRNLTESEAREFDSLETKLTTAEEPYFETRGTGAVEGRTEADLAFTRYLRTGEIRATGTGLSSSPDNGQTGSDNAGYTIPQGFWRMLWVALKAYGGIAADYHQVETDTGNPMPWPTIDPTAVVASLVTSELNPLAISNPYVFGQGMLSGWTIAVGPVLAALQLIEDSAFDVDQFIASRFGEALGREIAALAVSGTGSSQPLGIITALTAKGAVTSSGGYLPLTAATSVSTLGGSKTELVGNLLSPQTLLNMVKSVDPAYRNDPDGNATAKFYVNDAQLAGMRTVVDQYGHPLLQDPSHESGEPTLWGYPVKVDNNIPNLVASTTGGPVFGNLDHAMVMRTVKSGARVLRLDQRYADYLAVGYLGYYRCDIRSNDLRAAVTVQAQAT